MKFHPDILAAHAEFGGDLADMQRRYDAATPTAIEASPVVGEIEAVAWRWRYGEEFDWNFSPSINLEYAMEAGVTVEGLVPAASLASLQSENQALREARAAWEETRLANAHLNNEPTDEQVERAKRIIERALLLHISPLVIRAALKAAGPSAQQCVSEEERGQAAYRLTQQRIIDMPTARALVDEVLAALSPENGGA